MASSLIEHCQVVPHPGAAPDEFTLPLTIHDIYWFGVYRMRVVLFYKHPISKIDFIKTIIPSLKDSLSLTLKYYLSLAGNVVCPINSNGYPELRYVSGDSVSLTFSQTDMDFSFLTGNNPRNAKDFYTLVPQLADPMDATSGVQLAPVLAIQVTLFPDHGLSIGFTNHHVAGDGASMVRFIRAWGLLNKFGGDEQSLTDELIPFYDRSLIKDPYGLVSSMWDEMKKLQKIKMCDIVSPPQDKVRGTFILRQDDIGKLKNLTLSKHPSLTHVTSFVVTSAYIWTCLIKSEAAIGEETDENKTEFFFIAADLRARLNPPIPPNYFGNCVGGYIARTKHANLIGKEGFTIAAESISEAIRNGIKDEDYKTIDIQRTVSIAGSPKFDLYAVDFGWGRTEKFEFVSIDSGDDGITMSLSRSRDSEVDLEIGLSLRKNRFDAFAAIFAHGLGIL